MLQPVTDALRSALPLMERKAQFVGLRQGVQLVNELEAHGVALFAKAVELGLEGIVGKRADSPYRAGRQPAWGKIKNPSYYRPAALGVGR